MIIVIIFELGAIELQRTLAKIVLVDFLFLVFPLLQEGFNSYSLALQDIFLQV